MLDTLEDVEIIELVMLDEDLPCQLHIEADPCSRPAAWLFHHTCCDIEMFACQLHKDWYVQTLARLDAQGEAMDCNTRGKLPPPVSQYVDYRPI